MKYIKCIPAKPDRYFSHYLKDVHFPGEPVFDALVGKLEVLPSLFDQMCGYGEEDNVQAVHLLPQEREVTEMVDGVLVERDVVNFTVTLLFNNRRPFIFFFDIPFSEVESSWVDEAVSAFISQATIYLVRKAERRGYIEGRKTAGV